VLNLQRDEERENALVALFARMTDRAAVLPKILLSCFRRPQVEALQARLGPLHVFDEARPAGRYTFDLAKHSDLAALRHLVLLRKRVPGTRLAPARLAAPDQQVLTSDGDAEHLLETNALPAAVRALLCSRPSLLEQSAGASPGQGVSV
jgi:hypothetical protein